MIRTKKFSKASILGVAAVSTLFTACDLINDFIPADPNPGDPKPQISSSSNVVPTPASSSSAISPASSNSAPSAFQTWRGTDGDQRIITGVDNGTETSGYWFSYADKADGGESKIIWPVEIGDVYSDESLQPVVEHCNGICGTAALRKGALTYQPFVGVGFTIAGETEYGEPAAADVSSMGGVCVSYASEVPVVLEMSFTDDIDARLGYANPMVTLPKATSGITKFIPWSNFKQPSWYTGAFTMSGDQGATQLALLRFRFQANQGDYRFNITEVGSLNGCTGVPASLDFTSQEIPPIDPPKPPQPPVPQPNNFETWFGTSGSAQINTGYDNGSETSGYWFTYSDAFDGGMSTIVWPVEIGHEYDYEAKDPVIEHCGGLCGKAVLDQGSLVYQPYVGVGFNLAGESYDGGKADIVDASAMGGVCITYTSSTQPVLEMGLGEEMDAAIGYANPAVALPKSLSSTTRFIPWSSFKQPSWYSGKKTLTGEEAAKNLANLKFKIQAQSGEYDFNIQAIGPYNGGTCAPQVIAQSK
ncbi:MAG: hypothetical protein IJM92_13160 [Fibrobacter sp.]|uniref:hypothetical protein n=1 Tax=Fibrobacter sp. TaxID=35828 RepID=UPI0025C04746|nr:hypothetical protein [Fibrobacter sp.]MBQ7080574.1 hypothetical protein [Fibrobacter sp.]